MGKFLQKEKPFQAAFKLKSPVFTDGAKADGFYKTRTYPFCLPRAAAEENLFPGIRRPIIDYFHSYEIKWHDGQDGKPSNHMCDSMVCCANFLFPFYNQPEALAALLRPLFPGLVEMLPVENGSYVAFEWTGAYNYLGEKISRNGKRTRGANFTSTDAAVRFRREDGAIQVVLIEWKYTESYYATRLQFAPSGTDRTKIDEHLYYAADCPLDKARIPGFESLFYEPFYQFMRQQFLAHEMEKAHELDTGRVSLLHISPRRNTDFYRVTSPDLRELGETATQVWGKLVKQGSDFLAVYAEDLFGGFPIQDHRQMQDWWDYLTARYRWVSKQVL